MPRTAPSYLFCMLAGLVFCACSNSEYANDMGHKNAGRPAKQVFSEFPESGFFKDSFTVELSENDSLNCEVGGKIPSAQSPRTSTFEIGSTTTIRCVDFSDTAKAEIIRTYIFEEKPTIATVFLTTDPNSLFDPDSGIYMMGPDAQEEVPHEGANYGLDKEIPVYVELVESDQDSPAFAKHAGLKIFGKYSRMNPKKSVSINFREKYGERRLYYPLFPEFPELTVFKSFVLRNNGNNYAKDYIRDRLASSLSEGLGVDYQRGRFAIVYYNGEYYGIHDLRERSNESYIETHYGIGKNNINLLKSAGEPTAGSVLSYNAMIQWLKSHSLDVDSNYAHIDSLVDIDNLLNYLHTEIFANNMDWPGNNLKRWNIINPQSKWKWILYDIDAGFGTLPNDDVNIFEYITSQVSYGYKKNSPIATFLIRSLLKNKDFEAAFINRLAVLLQTNFEQSKILARIDKMMSEIEQEIPRDQERWSHDAAYMDEQLDVIKNFAKTRADILTDNLRDFFDLEETVPVKLSTSGPGTILVHGLPLNESEITVNFFKKHPVTLTAKPQKGHKWGGWSDGDTNTTRIIWPEKTPKIAAVFR